MYQNFVVRKKAKIHICLIIINLAGNFILKRWTSHIHCYIPLYIYTAHSDIRMVPHMYGECITLPP